MKVNAQYKMMNEEIQNKHTVDHKVEPKIKEYFDENNGGIILWNQSTIDKIKELSGPLTSGNEYQVHYWAKVLRFKHSGSILDICIPTVVFNYKQTVTSAHIDFHLQDVEDISNALSDLHNIVANSEELINLENKLSKMLSPSIGEPEHLKVSMNTLHKHPGSPKHQCFSGTDLNKDHLNKPGIVFPLIEGNLQPSFSGIMAHEGGKNLLAHFEYRIVKGKITDDTTVDYYKGHCLSITYSKSEDIEAVEGKRASPIQKIFGIKDVDPVPFKNGITEYRLNTREDIDDIFIQQIKQVLNDTDYESNVEFIDKENVSTRKSEYIATYKYQDTPSFDFESGYVNYNSYQKNKKSNLTDISSKLWISRTVLENKMSSNHLAAKIIEIADTYYPDFYHTIIGKDEILDMMVNSEKKELITTYYTLKEELFFEWVYGLSASGCSNETICNEICETDFETINNTISQLPNSGELECKNFQYIFTQYEKSLYNSNRQGTTK